MQVAEADTVWRRHSNRVRDQVQVWTDTYERDLTNLLGLQAELGQCDRAADPLRSSPERARAITLRQTRNAKPTICTCAVVITGIR